MHEGRSSSRCDGYRSAAPSPLALTPQRPGEASLRMFARPLTLACTVAVLSVRATAG
jgi:hypothetical protein